MISVLKMQCESVDEFINAFSEKEAQRIVEIIAEHDAESLEKILAELSSIQLDDLWRNLYSHCQNHIASALTDIIISEEVDKATRVVATAVKLGKVNLKRNPLYISKDFFNTVTFLNGWLLDLPDVFAVAKKEIGEVCEEWLALELDGKDVIAAYTIINVLQSTLDNSTKKNLKRTWNIRKCLNVTLDQETETGKRILKLLFRCQTSKQFLSAEQGLKFIAFLITLDCTCSNEFHLEAKNHLMFCSRKEAEAYGKIYFKAWCNSAPELKEKFETECIQEMIYFAIHLKKSEDKLFSSIRTVLNRFKCMKHEKRVASMLLKLHAPITWRCLKVANECVRMHAAIVMFDLFPIEDPSGNLEDVESSLLDQYNSMQDLLYDKGHTVREVAALGVCQVMKQQWEIIPTEIRKKWLLSISNDLVYDSSCSEVRAAVVKGISLLLENELSHTTLKDILLKMGNKFHDVSEKVRLAFCNLLLKIHALTDWQFWKIVTMEHLLARLEMDSENICRSIFQLICNSFFPMDKTEGEILFRCVDLIKRNRGASRKFYHFLAEYADLDNIAKYMIATARALRKTATKRLEKQNGHLHEEDDLDLTFNKENLSENSNISSSEDEEDDDDDNDNCEKLLSKPDIVAGLLDSICILWWRVSINRREEVSREHTKPISQAMHEAAWVLFKFFKKSVIIQQSLIYMCCGMQIPLPNVTSKRISMLRALPESASTSQYITLLASVCLEKDMLEILELIFDWIESPLKEKLDQPNKQRKPKVMVVDPVTPKPLLAIHFLKDLLELSRGRKILLKHHFQILKEKVSTHLPLLQDHIEDYCVAPTNTGLVSGIFLKEAFSQFCQMAMLLHQPPNEKDRKWNAVSVMRRITLWVQKELLPLKGSDSAALTEDNLSVSETTLSAEDLLRSVVETLLKIMADMYLINVIDPSFFDITEDFIYAILQLESGEVDLFLISRLLYQMTSCVMTMKACLQADGAKNETPEQDQVLSSLYNKFIQTISRNNKQDWERGSKELIILKPEISSILQLLLDWLDEKDLLLHDVIATMMAACIAEVTKIIDKFKSFDGYDCICDLPTVTSTLLGIFSTKRVLMRVFLYELEECLKVEVIKKLAGCLAIVHILRTLSFDAEKSNVDPKDLQKATDSVENLYQKLKPSDDTKESSDESVDDGDLSGMMDTALTELKQKLIRNISM